MALDCGLEFDRSALSNLLESSFVPAELNEWPIAKAVVSEYKVSYTLMMDGGFSRRMSGDRFRCGPSVSVSFEMVPMVLCPASHRRVLEESLTDSRNLVEVRDARRCTSVRQAPGRSLASCKFFVHMIEINGV